MAKAIHKRPAKLFTYRTLWISLALTPLILFTGFMLALFIRQQNTAVRQIIEQAALANAQTLERILGEQIGLLQGLSVSHFLDNADFTEFRRDAARLWELHPEWRTILLTDHEKPILNLYFKPGQPIPPIRDPDSLKRVLDSRNPFIGNLANGYVAIRIPVLRQDQVLYTLVAPTHTDFFSNALHRAQDSLFGIIIYGNDGIVITASPNAPVQKGDHLPARFNANRTGILSMADKLYSQPVPVLLAGWEMITFSPITTIRKPFLQKRLAVLTSGGMAVTLAIVISFLLSAVLESKKREASVRARMEEREEAFLRHRELVKASNIGLWDWNLVSNQIRFSPEWKYQIGYAETELQDDYREWESRIHPDDLDRVLDHIQASIKTLNQNHQAEFRFRHRDGSYRWILAHATVLSDDHGKAVRMIGSHLDITERKRQETERKEIETQLMQAQKMESIGTLAGGVAHDFNNILYIILGNTDLALQTVSPQDPVHVFLTEIESAGVKASSIVKQLLNYSRKTDQALKPIRVNNVVRDAVGFVRSMLPSSISVKTQITEEEVTILGNPVQLNQILINLCSNSAQAMEQTGGEIMIRLETIGTERHGEPPQMQLSVIDNGPGISVTPAEKIFEPYFTTKDLGKGTGLGLSVVQGIVTHHRGTIRVKTNPGDGTVFFILLPLYQGIPDTEPISTVPLMSGRESILVVDDDDAIAVMLTKMLTRLGYTVRKATSPKEALDIFYADPHGVDLVISDVTMPQMTGVLLARHLKARRADIPVILCTGYNASLEQQPDAAKEVDSILSKPLSLPELSECVRKILDKPRIITRESTAERVVPSGPG